MYYRNSLKNFSDIIIGSLAAALLSHALADIS